MKKEKAQNLQTEKKKKKNHLKRISNTLTFLILLGFAGFVFYLGWVQFSIPENHYALAFTKTGGYDPYLMKPGEFYWRWENLFPTNMELHIFELPWEATDFNLQGELPSGSDYASILTNPDAFNFSLSLRMNFRMNPDKLISMIQKEGFTFKEIESWYTLLPEAAEAKIKNYILQEIPLETAEYTRIEASILEYMESQFPYAEFSGFHIHRWELPDKTLYDHTREIYLNGIKSNREYAAELEKQNAELERQLNSKMELLKDYGSVLTEYPVLLEYFNLEKEKIDPMIFGWESGQNQDSEP